MGTVLLSGISDFLGPSEARRSALPISVFSFRYFSFLLSPSRAKFVEIREIRVFPLLLRRFVVQFPFPTILPSLPSFPYVKSVGGSRITFTVSAFVVGIPDFKFRTRDSGLGTGDSGLLTFDFRL